jgi:preprotein translocase subunit SecG
MKKVTAILMSLLCIVSLNLAFAGSATNDGGSKQPTTQRPRFQR